MKRLLSFICVFFTMCGFAVPLPEYHRIFLPMISGDAFRTYADFAYDDHDKNFDPKKVKPGNTIFVQADLAAEFFEKFHAEIPCRYILITHNSDAEVPGMCKGYLEDGKLIAWFGENWDGYVHPKMHQIPMGLANTTWPNGNGDTVTKVIEMKVAKAHLAHMGLTIQTNYKERWEVFRLFSQAPYVYRTIKKVFEKYLIDVAASQFEMAPRGFAWDTYRLWECLYVGTIPIVRTSQLDSLYEDLPVLIIKDWKEVNQKFLEEKILELSGKTYKMEKLTFDYWTKWIDSFKNL